MNRAVFLDRDGVINAAEVREGKPYSPLDLESLRILPKVFESLKDLNEAGWLLIVVTNQPDIARGLITYEKVMCMHKALGHKLPFILEFRTCPHDDQDACLCRKPSPGALLEAARVHNIDLERSFMIGDRWRDIEAGHNAGCKTIFINYHYVEEGPKRYTYEASTLREAANFILLEGKESYLTL
jgi:D-glycero-D-manno-heptose 1,7-bisphosphate phosphatase